MAFAYLSWMRWTEKAILNAAGRVGAPDVLFNCSGFVHHGTVLEVDDDAFDFSFNLNVKAHFRVVRAFLPLMIENGGGGDYQYVIGGVEH